MSVESGSQLRAARALLNISVSVLSEDTGLAINTIRRAESSNEQPPITAANINLLRSYFEGRGIVFLPFANDHGLGVAFASEDPPPYQALRRD